MITIRRLLKLLGFVRKNEKSTKSDDLCHPKEYISILDFNTSLDALLTQDKFIARSDYKPLIRKYEKSHLFFSTLEKSQTLEYYIANNNLNTTEIKKFLATYKQVTNLVNVPSFIKEHNDSFIKKHLNINKKYLDNILKECDPNILLDNEQREVVLSDEDYSLVIAGAGAGKTTTIVAKVRYLIEKQDIKPEDILVISFTNKAVSELQERINKQLKLACTITTFHSIGNTIINMSEDKVHKIVDEGYMYNVINNYLRTIVLRDSELVDKLILFFGSYIDAPYEGEELAVYFDFISKAEFSTLKSNFKEYIQTVIDSKTKKVKTLNNETLRSQEEVNIANFLYLHQIDYEYEPFYQYRILDSNKPYTPDFLIRQDDKVTYIEHFGINQDGTHTRYSQDDLDKYKTRINDKIKLHRKHKTDLIYTFSRYNDGRDYLSHLKEELVLKGYKLNRRSSEEVYQKIIDDEERRYISRLTKLICNFLRNFKIQGFNEETINNFKSSIKNVRTRLFLDIFKPCYLEYKKCLIQDSCIDFQDMINESTELIKQQKIKKNKINFKYIIVDEYQDISNQRYNLIKELSSFYNAKIVAVGDDWQSIYAFSGSNITLFTRFCEIFGYGQELKITRTYRNAQELINIAGNFVQKNIQQIQKSLISNKSIDNPVIIRTFNDNKENYKENEKKGGVFHYMGEAVNQSIQEILDYNKEEGKHKISEILLLGRYGFDARNLCNSEDFNYDENNNTIYSVKYGRKVKLNFLTAHSSKGLSADNVIIINAKDEVFGFPSQIEDDPILQLVITEDKSYNYAEERRLFYVALTRTRNRVFIITPKNKPSEFIKELLREKQLYPNVKLIGDINNSIIQQEKKKCPICGYPMQRRKNKNYGLDLWICMNDQEVCGFMTNDYDGGDLSIQKCDSCKDGYLIVKPGKGNSHFLGCTNYKADKSGCNRSMSRQEYFKSKDDSIGKEDPSANMSGFQKHKKTTRQKAIKKSEDVRKSKASNINTTTTKNLYLGNEGFDIVCDAKGNILTDIDLLIKLISLRNILAKDRNKSVNTVMNKETMVDIATRHPMTYNELLLMSGIGERKAELYGEAIIQIIKEHNKN